MPTIEEEFLAKKSKYIVLKEIGSEFVGIYHKVNTTPIIKSINGVEDSYLRYEFIDEETGDKKQFDTKSSYQIKALSKFVKGDKIQIRAIQVVDEKDPSKQVKRLSFTLLEKAPVKKEAVKEEPEIPIINENDEKRDTNVPF